MGLRFWMAFLLGLALVPFVTRAGAPQEAASPCSPSLQGRLESWVPEYLLYALAEISTAGSHSAREIAEKIRFFGRGLSPDYLGNLANEYPIQFQRSSPVESGSDPIENWAAGHPQRGDESLPTYLTRMAVGLTLAERGVGTEKVFIATQDWAKKIVERLIANGSLDRLFYELTVHHPEEWAGMRANVCGLPSPTFDPGIRASLDQILSTIDELQKPVTSASSSLNHLNFMVLASLWMLVVSHCSAH